MSVGKIIQKIIATTLLVTGVVGAADDLRFCRHGCKRIGVLVDFTVSWPAESGSAYVYSGMYILKSETTGFPFVYEKTYEVNCDAGDEGHVCGGHGMFESDYWYRFIWTRPA